MQEEYVHKLDELNDALVKKGIPENWLLENIQNEKFEIYENMLKLYQIMPESRVKNKEKDFKWYKNQFGVADKIELGKKFIESNLDILKKAESINGIHYELIAAILGMETNYGEIRFAGNYYVFSSLISQYLFFKNKKNFVINELISLYYFSVKINKPVYYFKGSFLGASGLAQFMPSSLLNYFIDVNSKDNDIDIYAIDDTIFSIQNYLFLNGLNKLNINNYQSRYYSVFCYNPSKAYSEAVLEIYDELRKLRKDKYQ